MDTMIYNPLEEYCNKFKDLHLHNTTRFLDELVHRSGINADENRKTVKEHDDLALQLKKLKKKRNLWRFLRFLMIITLILIPLVILKITPKIRAIKAEIESADKRIAELLALAHQQMAPLNALFTAADALRIIETTIPQLSFSSLFSVDQEVNMRINYDFDGGENDNEQSTVDVLAGHYNENPFLFENRLIHRMGTEIYHGYKTIRWTETYRGSDGKMHTRTRSETLHATLTKPKPFYHTQVVLNYCAQGGPELCFTRDATHLEQKSEKEIDRYVKKGEKRLKKMTDEAIRENKDFVSMSNTDFEVLFDALDRTDEVQFRTLFTPLAQTNMVDLIRSQSGYGDDFNFIKQQRTNKIITQHSQNRPITLQPGAYYSHSFDTIRDNFIGHNANYFKERYFDFAPVLAIPIYQERPVHSLHPIPDDPQTYSRKECESLANRVNAEFVVHPHTKTKAILKSSFLRSDGDVDHVRIRAYSYDVIPRVDFVPVHGGDGRWHNVPIQWDDYIPLEADNRFHVALADRAKGKNIMAQHGDLCIFN